MKACCILASTELDVPKEQAQGPTIFLSLNSNKKKITAIRLHSPSVFSQRTQTQHYKRRRGTLLLTSDYLHSNIKVDFSLNLSLYPMGVSYVVIFFSVMRSQIVIESENECFNR